MDIIAKRMRPNDARAFLDAAKHLQVYILVRRTNEASIKYIGKPGFMPKRIDSKAKTASRDFYHSGLRLQLAVGGLVVDPTIPGFERAFIKNKYATALREWLKFRKLVADVPFHELKGVTPPGKLYAVQREEGSNRYGCVMLARSGYAFDAKYLHGDYDLYAVFHKNDPIGKNFLSNGQLWIPGLEAKQGTLHGMRHMEGKYYSEVRDFVNGRVRGEVVQHSYQSEVGHTQEPLDIFCPDGTIKAMGARLMALTD